MPTNDCIEKLEVSTEDTVLKYINMILSLSIVKLPKKNLE